MQRKPNYLHFILQAHLHCPVILTINIVPHRLRSKSREPKGNQGETQSGHPLNYFLPPKAHFYLPTYRSKNFRPPLLHKFHPFRREGKNLRMISTSLENFFDVETLIHFTVVERLKKTKKKELHKNFDEKIGGS